MYAIVDVCGIEYRVELGKEIIVKNVSRKIGDEVEFENIILMDDGKKEIHGKPYIKNKKVYGIVTGKNEKESDNLWIKVKIQRIGNKEYKIMSSSSKNAKYEYGLGDPVVDGIFLIIDSLVSIFKNKEK